MGNSRKFFCETNVHVVQAVFQCDSGSDFGDTVLGQSNKHNRVVTSKKPLHPHGT